MTNRLCSKSICHVVILDWYGAEDTEQCVKTLLHHEPNVTITVIDNSEDHSAVRDLSDKYRGIEFIFNDTNIGFAGGCNQGFLISVSIGSNYTLFLNNDTVITEPFIDELVEWMRSHDKAGAASPLINYYSSPETAWFHGASINGVTMDIVHNNDTQCTMPKAVPWLTACAMIVSNVAFKSVGGFDESFFMYSEDVDLSLRLRAKGYELYVYPKMSVLHKVSKSTSKVSRKSLHFSVRNKLVVLRTHFPARKYIGARHLMQNTVRDIVRGPGNPFVKISLIITAVFAFVEGLTKTKDKK